MSGGGSPPSRTRDWDAATYQRVSVPHQEWARSILDRLELDGDERVLDAGCGSGRVTSMLIERLPRGSVVAVDGSRSMIEEVRSVLRPHDEAIVADLVELELPEPVDVVFSSAVFHWVLDHGLLSPEDVVDLGQELLRGRARAGHRPGFQDSLPERLAGDGAGPQAHPSQAGLLLDDRRPLAQLGRLHGRPLTGGAAADANEVIVVRWDGPGAHDDRRQDSIAGTEIRLSQAHRGRKMNGVADKCPR